ncbi:MAG TPA: bifunctional phosphopantothenoylcysteine decarboxylase/phosphopantothenate--cysteine ligase CoaBC, partial [Patescibacteria group bacterium]|nr:bifunctional phosphopantothenoylcysteine decarboxylase/phosphopantothenate--cysteine ligase CoaBC [Patescibacteria group bacterium]
MDHKNVVIGISGGIAAYKAVEIVSRLKKAGCNVHVIMTQAATRFITPLTLREISGNPVVFDMWTEVTNWNVEHISLATMADVFLIAPATANIIGKMAGGIADDMLSTTVMATTAPVILCPAMNTNMYLHPIVQENIAKLKQLGHQFIDPDSGQLACGTEGPGRLPEPVRIVQQVLGVLSIAGTRPKDKANSNGNLRGKKVLITAGGTREPIDPVRYIGNRSSGKMGYALAEAARDEGAEVLLISGMVDLSCPPGITRVTVETAEEMRQAVLAEFDHCDIVVKAAAVADYRVAEIQPQKIKKTGDTLTLNLVKNPDILKELGQRKAHQYLVGFAAETQELLQHATAKLEGKNLDMLVANDVTMAGAGFQSDTNIVKLLFADGRVEDLPQMSKRELAIQIWQRITAELSIR